MWDTSAVLAGTGQRPHLPGPFDLDGTLPCRGISDGSTQRGGEGAGERRVGRQVGDALLGDREELRARDGRPGQAGGDSVVGSDVAGEHAGGGRDADAARPGEQVQVSAAGMQPDPGEAGDEYRIGRDDAQVCDEGEVQAGADRSAVDRGDSRDAQLPDPSERGVQVLEAVVYLVRAPATQAVQDAGIGAGAERWPGPGDDRRPDARVGVDLPAGGEKISGRAGVQSVPGRGAVQSDPRRAVRDAQLDLRPGHQKTSPTRWPAVLAAKRASRSAPGATLASGSSANHGNRTTACSSADSIHGQSTLTSYPSA